MARSYPPPAGLSGPRPSSRSDRAASLSRARSWQSQTRFWLSQSGFWLGHGESWGDEGCSRLGPRGGRLRRSAAVAAVASALACLPLAAGPRAWGEDLFTAQAVDGSRFAVLARPVGRDDWNLLVLEQLAAEPRCWTARPDGLVDPSLNRFNFTGICSRYIDSNGYSVRVGEQDLATSYRLRLEQVGQELQLLASTVSVPTDLLVGRGTVPLRDRDGFVELRLEPGWSLQRRAYRGRGLSHVYFANGDSLSALLARLQPSVPEAPAGLAAATQLGRRLPPGGSLPGSVSPALAALPGPLAIPGRPIPLPVIPFRE